MTVVNAVVIFMVATHLNALLFLQTKIKSMTEGTTYKILKCQTFKLGEVEITTNQMIPLPNAASKIVDLDIEARGLLIHQVVKTIEPVIVLPGMHHLIAKTTGRLVVLLECLQIVIYQKVQVKLILLKGVAAESVMNLI